MIHLRKPKLNRRTFLRGAIRGGGTVLVGLPLLEAMLDDHGEALAAGAPLPKRFVSWFFGNGVSLDAFEPDQAGTSTYNLSPLLQDLADVKDYLTVCTGLQNKARIIQTHHEGLTAFNGYDQIELDLGGPIASDLGGPTIDQLVADHIRHPQIHSIQFQVAKTFSNQDAGSTSQCISAQGLPGRLTFKRGETSPRALWQSIFGMAPIEGTLRKKMLDFVRADIGNIRGRLGSADQLRMDAHLAALSELEGEVAACSSTVVTEENADLNPFERVKAVSTVMAELLAMCFACDATRVASVLFLPMVSDSYFNVDVPTTTSSSYHTWSHNGTGLGSDGRIAYDSNVRFVLNCFGDWMRALRNKTETDGTNLLDSTILYASSDHGWFHQLNRQPVLLGGHGRGHLKFPGIHFQAIAGDPNLPASGVLAAGSLNLDAQPAARNTSDVLLTCLRGFDPAATAIGEFGASTNPHAKPGDPPGSTTPLCEIESGLLPCP